MLRPTTKLTFWSQPSPSLNAPAGIRTRVLGSKIRNDWPDYTTGATVNLNEPAETREIVYDFWASPVPSLMSPPRFELGTTGSLRANHPNMDDGHIRPALHQAKLRARRAICGNRTRDTASLHYAMHNLARPYYTI